MKDYLEEYFPLNPSDYQEEPELYQTDEDLNRLHYLVRKGKIADLSEEEEKELESLLQQYKPQKEDFDMEGDREDYEDVWDDDEEYEDDEDYDDYEDDVPEYMYDPYTGSAWYESKEKNNPWKDSNILTRM